MNDTIFPGYPAHKVLFASFLFAVCFHLALFAVIHHFPSFARPKIEAPQKLRVHLARAPSVKHVPDIHKIHPSRYSPPVPPKEKPKPKMIEKPKPKVEKKAPKKVLKKRTKPIPKKALKPEPRPEPKPEPVQAEPSPVPQETKPAVPVMDTSRTATAPPPQTVQETTPGPSTPPAPRREMAYPDYGKSPALTYPPLARRRGLEGKVILKVLVSKEGHPLEVTLEESSGHSILDKSALKAVRDWVFKPGKLNGQPVKMWVQVPVVYRLK